MNHLSNQCVLQVIQLASFNADLHCVLNTRLRGQGCKPPRRQCLLTAGWSTKHRPLSYTRPDNTGLRALHLNIVTLKSNQSPSSSWALQIPHLPNLLAPELILSL